MLLFSLKAALGDSDFFIYIYIFLLLLAPSFMFSIKCVSRETHSAGLAPTLLPRRTSPMHNLIVKMKFVS